MSWLEFHNLSEIVNCVSPLWSSNKHLEVGYISNWMILILNISPICNGKKETTCSTIATTLVGSFMSVTIQCKCWEIQQSDGSTSQPNDGVGAWNTCVSKNKNKIWKGRSQKNLASQKSQWQSATHRGCLSHQDTCSSQLGQPGQPVHHGQGGQWKLKQKNNIGFGFGLVSPLYFWRPTKKLLYQNFFTKYIIFIFLIIYPTQFII